MKRYTITFDGIEYSLLYNIDAYLTLNERYADLCGGVCEPFSEEAAVRLADCIAVMAEQGELMRRSLGYDRQAIPTADMIRGQLTIRRYAEARGTVIGAIIGGVAYEHGEDGEEDIDLTLREIEKDGGGLTEAQFYRMATAAGISVHDARYMRIGLVFGIFELFRPKKGGGGI